MEKWNAKYGDPRALATGRCTLITHAIVQRINTDDRGKAMGISFFVGDEPRTATAEVVICSGERLNLHGYSSTLQRRAIRMGLAMIRSGGPPSAGAHYSGAFGIMPESIFDGIGPVFRSRRHGLTITTPALWRGFAGK